MIKKLRILKIIFDTPIEAREVPLFRGAIINKVGRESVLFHNHDGDGYVFHYPLIQYKRIKGNAAIICIERGIDEIHKLFSEHDWTINIGKRQATLKILSLNVETYNLNVWDKFFNYKIVNYIPFNDKNYLKYKKLESEEEKNEFLKKILIGNIISFAKGVDWTVENEVKIKDLDIFKTKKLYIKGTSFLGFYINFKTNVYLPSHIGLGKAVAKGFGQIFKLKNENFNIK